MKRNEVEEIAKKLEALKSRLDESVGRQKLLKRQLKQEFGIEPSQIAEKHRSLKTKKEKLKQLVAKNVKIFRKKWRAYFEDEECPI